MENKADRKAVGKRIRELRKKHNETQKDLANIIKTTPNSISKLENGDIGLTFENMLSISEHYNVSLDFLCKGEGGTNLLDTLNKYVKLYFRKFSGVTDTETIYLLPKLSIDRSFFDYLLQTANAKADSNLPEELKKQWIELETQKFNENIIHDTYQEYASVIPVKESIILNDQQLLVTISNTNLKDIKNS